ncbi:MAG: periplasmic heavy metal sensor [Acidimicrobiia bacterium]|nr:periplasmic heavy metal sensor [Acidimicrobiia bacterium]
MTRFSRFGLPGCPAAALAVVIGLMAPEPAYGQGPRGRWWQDGTVQREIGLTADQSTRIEGLFQEALPVLRRGKRQLDAAERDLARLIESDDSSESMLVQQVDAVEAARAAMNKTRTLMLLRMRRVLSAEQRDGLDALHRARERERGNRSSRH